MSALVNANRRMTQEELRDLKLRVEKTKAEKIGQVITNLNTLRMASPGVYKRKEVLNMLKGNVATNGYIISTMSKYNIINKCDKGYRFCENPVFYQLWEKVHAESLKKCREHRVKKLD